MSNSQQQQKQQLPTAKQVAFATLAAATAALPAANKAAVAVQEEVLTAADLGLTAALPAVSLATKAQWASIVWKQT